MTPRARTLAINNLTKFRLEGHNPNTILDKCTLNGWQGIYLPRDMEKKKMTAEEQIRAKYNTPDFMANIREVK